jgi:hypothetical protein
VCVGGGGNHAHVGGAHSVRGDGGKWGRHAMTVWVGQWASNAKISLHRGCTGHKSRPVEGEGRVGVSRAVGRHSLWAGRMCNMIHWTSAGLWRNQWHSHAETPHLGVVWVSAIDQRVHKGSPAMCMYLSEVRKQRLVPLPPPSQNPSPALLTLGSSGSNPLSSSAVS